MGKQFYFGGIKNDFDPLSPGNFFAISDDPVMTEPDFYIRNEPVNCEDYDSIKFLTGKIVTYLDNDRTYYFEDIGIEIRM